MRVFTSKAHEAHAPEAFIQRGERHANPEVPRRAEVLEAAVRAAGHEILTVDEAAPGDHDVVRRVHDADYLEFLATAWSQWEALPDHAPEIIPNVHPGRNMSGRPEAIVGLAGYYQTDTSCPIGPATWSAALAASSLALAGAREVRGGAPAAYALCRPPGHHAYADMAGGFCFINNSAVAAQHLRDGGAQRVAILDVDVHHGNGTQGIFYHRGDVLTVSLHGDPAHYYPYFAGFAAETGAGDGEGCNRNYPLARGVADDEYMESLDQAREQIARFDPDYLVVALGLDASRDDPLAYLSITTDGFFAIGRAIGDMGLPTVIVQEGGYLSATLGDNLAAALAGFAHAR